LCRELSAPASRVRFHRYSVYAPTQCGLPAFQNSRSWSASGGKGKNIFPQDNSAWNIRDSGFCFPRRLPGPSRFNQQPRPAGTIAAYVLRVKKLPRASGLLDIRPSARIKLQYFSFSAKYLVNLQKHQFNSLYYIELQKYKKLKNTLTSDNFYAIV
jgi:hypothetical protein